MNVISLFNLSLSLFLGFLPTKVFWSFDSKMKVEPQFGSNEFTLCANRPSWFSVRLFALTRTKWSENERSILLILCRLLGFCLIWADPSTRTMRLFIWEGKIFQDTHKPVYEKVVLDLKHKKSIHTHTHTLDNVLHLKNVLRMNNAVESKVKRENITKKKWKKKKSGKMKCFHCSIFKFTIWCTFCVQAKVLRVNQKNEKEKYRVLYLKWCKNKKIINHLLITYWLLIKTNRVFACVFLHENGFLAMNSA